MTRIRFSALVIFVVFAASLAGCKSDSGGGQVNLNAPPKNAPVTEGGKPAVTAQAQPN